MGGLLFKLTDSINTVNDNGYFSGLNGEFPADKSYFRRKPNTIQSYCNHNGYNQAHSLQPSFRSSFDRVPSFPACQRIVILLFRSHYRYYHSSPSEKLQLWSIIIRPITFPPDSFNRPSASAAALNESSSTQHHPY